MAERDIRLKSNCYQDGGVFYREDMDEPDFRLADDLGSDHYVIADYRNMVQHDHDMDGARSARERFAAEHPEFIA